MNIFAKKIDEPPATGIDAIRTRLRAWRNRSGSWGAVVRDTPNLGPSSLQAFVDDGKELPDAVIVDLVKVIYGGYVRFNIASRMLESVNDAPPLKLATGLPPRYTPPVDYKVPRSAGGPQPVDPKPVEVTTSRPGFSGEFFPRQIAPPVPEKKEKFVRVRDGQT